MKNSFIVQYSVHLWIAGLGIGSFWGAVVGFIAIRLLGSMLDEGILQLDIGLDKLKEAMKDPEWRDQAKAIYEKASARVYTEKEKDEIRKQYLKVLADYASFGPGNVVQPSH